ncbi:MULTISPECIES: hypothetical protein [Okeania]|uniref:Uncharacterized protein n=1 Tax=Okeania hirsuta TaxID=1458930 RepID=A0A3N6P8L7_9CYAN|nr:MULTISPECIES: hypothetical protein [Okeania]NEP03448.1 hypothetical protein [Okeania sp. SIO4D6]NEP37791.1 hypothetical protein [Okeania sp. SIO2H7]NEP71753.1 hypothetical protein [Okeania sp. SIO2G5]NEP92475.1 hypothetical protein [Okeania sp. SIO2F5]NEQ90453.1 hypothetical protein [Okeania sp. SIO2G4]
MDKKDIRSQAAKTFVDSFEKQLDNSLQEPNYEKSNSDLQDSEKSNQKFGLSELEEAIADIDQYMETNHQSQPLSEADSE